MKETEEERLINAIKRCRFCDHVQMAHKYLPKYSETVCCLDTSLSSKGEYQACSCKEFAPKDNLEFLQWKHDKKKEKKK